MDTTTKKDEGLNKADFKEILIWVMSVENDFMTKIRIIRTNLTRNVNPEELLQCSNNTKRLKNRLRVVAANLRRLHLHMKFVSKILIFIVEYSCDHSTRLRPWILMKFAPLITGIKCSRMVFEILKSVKEKQSYG